MLANIFYTPLLYSRTGIPDYQLRTKLLKHLSQQPRASSCLFWSRMQCRALMCHCAVPVHRQDIPTVVRVQHCREM